MSSGLTIPVVPPVLSTYKGELVRKKLLFVVNIVTERVVNYQFREQKTHLHLILDCRLI